MMINVVEITKDQAAKIILMNKYPHFLCPISVGEKIYIEEKYLSHPYFEKQKEYLAPYGLIPTEIELQIPE